jgi:hypothetical protein
MPWYQKPILQDAIVLDIQRGALVTGAYSLVSLHNYLNGAVLCLLARLCVLRFVDRIYKFQLGFYYWAVSYFCPLGFYILFFV